MLTEASSENTFAVLGYTQTTPDFETCTVASVALLVLRPLRLLPPEIFMGRNAAFFTVYTEHKPEVPEIAVHLSEMVSRRTMPIAPKDETISVNVSEIQSIRERKDGCCEIYVAAPASAGMSERYGIAYLDAGRISPSKDRTCFINECHFIVRESFHQLLDLLAGQPALAPVAALTGVLGPGKEEAAPAVLACP